MNEIEIGLAVSSRSWGDLLHRFLVDHGGARVTAQVMNADEAISERFQILLIDDICSFLTPRLVFRVKAAGKKVIGVFDPDEFADGKNRLLEAGVDLTVEAGAEPDEFLACLAILSVELEIQPPAEPGEEAATEAPGRLIVVGGPVGGTGVTEVALAVAQRLAEHRGSTALVDGDDLAPSVAQRLGLPLHPNLRSAIDAVHHRFDRLADCVQLVGKLAVLAGLAGSSEWSDVRPGEAMEVVTELANRYRHVVVNIGGQTEDIVVYGTGGRYGIARAMLERAGRIIGVGSGDPVGLTRLGQWLSAVGHINGSASRMAIINRAPGSRYRRHEITAELSQMGSVTSVWFLPRDPEVEHAAWAGKMVASGSFVRSVKPIADLVGASR